MYGERSCNRVGVVGKGVRSLSHFTDGEHPSLSTVRTFGNGISLDLLCISRFDWQVFEGKGVCMSGVNGDG